MPSKMSDEDIYREAKKRVKAKKDFWSHFTAWLTISIILVLIWALTGARSHLWFLWPMGIWGVFVLMHGLNVYIFNRRYNQEEIEKEAEKIRKAQD